MRLRGRALRHKRLRRKIAGTPERPRLCVYRSRQNMHAQLIDDVAGKTLMTMATYSKAVLGEKTYGGNVKAAVALGSVFGAAAVEKGFSAVVFDKAGYEYHGRVKALADACRKAGLTF